MAGSYLKAGFGEVACAIAGSVAAPGVGLAFSGGFVADSGVVVGAEAAFSSAGTVGLGSAVDTGSAALGAGSSFAAGAGFPSFLGTGFCEAIVVQSQQVNGQK